jgi:hypothetical protein
MRKILLIVVVGILVLSGIGASAITIENKISENEKSNSGGRDHHSPLAEFGTATWGSFCKYAHGALKQLWAEGQLDFYYVTLVTDKNSKASYRLTNDYNIYGYPTVFWDGGYSVDVGAMSIPSAKSAYITSINSCSSRSVYDIVITLKPTWMGGTNLKVECAVKNNEVNTYEGYLRVYIVEKVSSMGWMDNGGNLYTMAFLDYAFNQSIGMSSGGTWRGSITWNGLANGFPTVTKTNTFVIAAVFNDEWHQGYAYPPNNPFDAYYTDDCVGKDPATTNEKLETTQSILLNRLLERFPNAFPILRTILLK